MPPPSDPTHTVEVTCPGCFHPQRWDATAACPICHHRANADGRSGALLPVGTQLKGYLISKILQLTLFCGVNQAQTGASFTLESGHADESDSISIGVIVALVS